MIIILCIYINFLLFIYIMGLISSNLNPINNLVFLPPDRDEDYKFEYTNLIRSDNIQIPIIHIKTGSNTCLIYSHGNSEDLNDIFKLLNLMAKYLQIDIVGYDYTGYGYTQKYNIYPSETSCYKNIKDVVNYIKCFGYKDIILYGRSLGSGIVVHHASQCRFVGKVILEAPFKSISEVIIETELTYPIDMFVNKHKIHQIKNPIFIIHGTHDELIDVKHGVHLFNIHKDVMEKYNKQHYKPLWVYNAGHNDIIMTLGFNKYIEHIKQFILTTL